MRNQASQLRRGPTDAESRLWQYLRAHRLKKVHFRRQYAIGEYIVDFCAPRKKLVIELDGNPHLLDKENDEKRNSFLSMRGYRVLRFWNHEVLKNLDHVLQIIASALEKD